LTQDTSLILYYTSRTPFDPDFYLITMQCRDDQLYNLRKICNGNGKQQNKSGNSGNEDMLAGMLLSQTVHLMDYEGCAFEQDNF
jgi:hypothetical protein